MEKNTQPHRYHAFISYRHADNKEQGRQWATWLHQAIETYEVPKDLVGKKNGRGETIPARIYPVFRDEQELPAHADLGTSIVNALTQTKLLIVLCSPRAVSSTYVADEIDYFKKLGGSDRIIAAMIDGEPNASWDKGKRTLGFSKEDECFPQPLQFEYDKAGNPTKKRAEPIAADFRINNDGKPEQGFTTPAAYREHLKAQTKLSKKDIETKVNSYQSQLHLMQLKIIAGILGVPLGDLTQRDKEYQLEQARLKAKKLKQWLAVVSLLATVAIGLGFFAYYQKENAEFQEKIAKKATLRMQIEKDKALKSQGEFLVGLAKQEVDKGHYDTALLLGLNSLPGEHGGNRPLFNKFRDSLYNAVKETRKKLVLHHDHDVVGARYSKDGSFMLSYTKNGQVNLWDSSTNKKLHTYSHEGSVYYADISANNKHIVTASYYHPLRVWSVKSGDLLFELHHPRFEADIPNPPNFITISPSGKHLLTARFGTKEKVNSAYLWSLETGKRIKSFDHGSLDPSIILSASFTDNENYLLTMSEKVAKNWDLSTGKSKSFLFKGRIDDRIKSNKTNSHIYRIGADFEKKDNIIEIWEVNSKQKVFTFVLKNKVKSARFSHSNNMLLTSSDDQLVTVYSLNSGEILNKFNFETSVLDASFDKNDALISVVLAGGKVLVLDATTGEQVAILTSESPIKKAHFHPSRALLMAVSNKHVEVWDISDRRPLTFKAPENSWFLKFDLSPDGTKLATFSGNGEITVSSVLTGENIFSFSVNAFVYQLKFSPDSSKLVVASGDKNSGKASIWSIATEAKLFDFHHSGIIDFLSFSKNTQKLITASRDNTAKVWNINTGKELLSLQHKNGVRKAGFSHDSLRVFTISGKNSIAFWSVLTGKKLAQPISTDKFIDNAAFDPTDKLLVTYGSSNNVRNKTSNSFVDFYDTFSGQKITQINNQGEYRHEVYNKQGQLISQDITIADTDNVMFLLHNGEFHFKQQFVKQSVNNGDNVSVLSENALFYAQRSKKGLVELFSAVTGQKLDSIYIDKVRQINFTINSQNLLILGSSEVKIIKTFQLDQLLKLALEALPQYRRCLSNKERRKYFLTPLTTKEQLERRCFDGSKYI